MHYKIDGLYCKSSNNRLFRLSENGWVVSSNDKHNVSGYKPVTIESEIACFLKFCQEMRKKKPKRMVDGTADRYKTVFYIETKCEMLIERTEMKEIQKWLELQEIQSEIDSISVDP